jgi:hypothetical protein
MSYADDARTVFDDLLHTLDDLAGKAEAAGMGDAILSATIADGMFPLELQFRVAVNQPILALIRHCDPDLPLDAETYPTLAHVRERIGAIRALVRGIPAAGWVPAGKPIDFTLPDGRRFAMTAAEHIRDWILPNLYFHTTMAYAILRHRGLDLGKFDFVPQMARYAVASPG